MKSLSLISLLLVAGITGASAQSMLKVRLTDNSRINVSVDGRYFNKTGTSITVGDLPPGRHYFTVYTMQQDRRGRGHEETVYSGKIFTHAGNITLFSFDPYNQDTHVEEQDMGNYMPPQPNQGGTYDNNALNQRNDNNNDNDNRYIQPNNPPASPISRDQVPTLADSKITQLKAGAAAKKTDTDIMKLLKDGLNGEKMTTDQVGAMMDWFSFEDSKVEFAKWAYPNTVDKENFSSLESKFTYKNYEDDLDKFIKDNMK